MAVGLPVLSTLHSGIPRTGRRRRVPVIWSPENDVTALTNRLVRLIDQPERWPMMGRGRARQNKGRLRHRNPQRRPRRPL